MADDLHLTKEEESALRELARRQREAQTAEAELLAKYGARAALAKQVWVVASTAVAALVMGTMYVMQVKTDVSTNQKDISAIRIELAATQKELRDVQIAMARKADRP